MNSKESIENISGSAATSALLAAVPIFLILITYGWHEIIDAILPKNSMPWLTWVGAFFVAVIGIMLARAVAAERLRLSIVKNSRSRYSWIAPFIVLFTISALGSINTFFMLSQGRSVVFDGFSMTNARLKALEQAINEQLKTPLYDQGEEQASKVQDAGRQAVVNFENSAKRDLSNSMGNFAQGKQAAEAAWTQFQAEMKNPLQMGYGIAARQRMAELKRYLPDLTIISGLEKLNQKSDPDRIDAALEAMASNVNKQMQKVFDESSIKCSFSQETNKLYAEMKEKIPGVSALQSSSAPCPRAEESLKTIISTAENSVAHMGATISGAEKPLVALKEEARETIGHRIRENNEFIAQNPRVPIEDSKKLLEKSWGDYASLYSRFKDLLHPRAKVNLPADISNDGLRNLGQITNVLALLLTRLSNPMTYFIFFGALLFDFVLITIYKRYLEVRVGDLDGGGSPFTGPNSNGSAPNIMATRK